MTEHRYAAILRAIADGKSVQLSVPPGKWHNVTEGNALFYIYQGDYTPERFRVKPETININGYEVPKPLDFMPEESALVYWPDFTYEGMVESVEVGYYPEVLSELLKNGLLHLTKEAAEAHAKALISFTKKP